MATLPDGDSCYRLHIGWEVPCTFGRSITLGMNDQAIEQENWCNRTVRCRRASERELSSARFAMNAGAIASLLHQEWESECRGR